MAFAMPIAAATIMTAMRITTTNSMKFMAISIFILYCPENSRAKLRKNFQNTQTYTDKVSEPEKNGRRSAYSRFFEIKRVKLHNTDSSFYFCQRKHSPSRP